jgi:hypothetical protein
MLIKTLLKAGARAAQLTPMGRILREIGKRGVDASQLRVLEVFANSGDSHVKDYASRVSALEMWEIEPRYETMLKRNFPSAQVKIVDSYEEIKKTPNKYELIVVDNGTSICDNHCEHFDLFPEIFRIAANSSILILNVIPEADHTVLKEIPYLFHEAQLVRRQEFYKTGNPKKISIDGMLKVYTELIGENGFVLEWHLVLKRSFVYYLVLKIKSRLNGARGSNKS